MMRGELFPIWPDMFREVWAPLGKKANTDLFCELYREWDHARLTPLNIVLLADIIDDQAQAKKAFRHVRAPELGSEKRLVAFLERAFGICADLGGDPLSNKFFVLMEAFLAKFSVRYDLRRPFSLHPTLPGVFSRMVAELKIASLADSDLHPLMRDFEESMRDLSQGVTPGRIKTCFVKQFNLLETLASKTPGVSSNTLGQMCGELQTWPHATVREAAKKIYGFRAYPGLGHGAQGGGAIREIECRDLVAISVLMTALAPYLTDRINPETIFGGAQ